MGLDQELGNLTLRKEGWLHTVCEQIRGKKIGNCESVYIPTKELEEKVQKIMDFLKEKEEDKVKCDQLFMGENHESGFEDLLGPNAAAMLMGDSIRKHDVTRILMELDITEEKEILYWAWW